jgi:hypothetical protein
MRSLLVTVDIQPLIFPIQQSACPEKTGWRFVYMNSRNTLRIIQVPQATACLKSDSAQVKGMNLSILGKVRFVETDQTKAAQSRPPLHRGERIKHPLPLKLQGTGD